MTRRNQPTPLRNPFRAPRANVHQTPPSDYRSIRQLLLQACWIVIMGTFLVTALSWAIPQPPSSQTTGPEAMALLDQPQQPQQHLPRKGGGVRGQSKLPPKKTSGFPKGDSSTRQGNENRWDPNDTLEQPAQDRDGNDDAFDTHSNSSGDGSEQSLENKASKDDVSEKRIPSSPVVQNTSPFGGGKNEETSVNADIKDTSEKRSTTDKSKESYDPNDPDEADEHPPPKKPNIQVAVIPIKKQTEKKDTTESLKQDKNVKQDPTKGDAKEKAAESKVDNSEVLVVVKDTTKRKQKTTKKDTHHNDEVQDKSSKGNKLSETSFINEANKEKKALKNRKATEVNPNSTAKAENKSEKDKVEKGTETEPTSTTSENEKKMSSSIKLDENNDGAKEDETKKTAPVDKNHRASPVLVVEKSKSTHTEDKKKPISARVQQVKLGRTKRIKVKQQE